MESQDSPDSQDPPALPVPQASAETSRPKCPTATTRRPEAWPCPGPWAQLVPVVFPALPVLPVLKVSKAPLVNLESPVLLVPWVPEVPPAPLARTEMMVKLASPAAPESGVPPAPRVLEVSPEPPACQA